MSAAVEAVAFVAELAVDFHAAHVLAEQQLGIGPP